jgi:hypothetical protein
LTKNREPTKGYLIVASRKENFYALAINLLEQIQDYYPEAKVCLVTEERFLDERAEQADKLILCDDHYRAKLWGMTQTPYDITFYIDADMECVHEDIALVFDELEDNDMVFAGLPEDRWYVFRDTEFPGGTFTLAGAVCLYDTRNPLVKDFMVDWYEYYKKQHSGHWWPTDESGKYDKFNYPYNLRIWDQFTLWWLSTKESKYDSLKINIFEDDLKWNYWTSLDRLRNPPKCGFEKLVLYHYSSTFDKGQDLNSPNIYRK